MLALKAEDGVKGLVNCEDEVYVAAGLGCTMGIMRHPFLNVSGNDFETVSRIKYKDVFFRLDEVVRAVRWSQIDKPVGVFGVFGSLKLKAEGLKGKTFRVFAQDLAGEKAVDISKAVTVSDNGIVIPGEVLNRIGRMAATPGDISSPGTVIRIYDAAERWTEEQAIEEVETIKRLNERNPRP